MTAKEEARRIFVGAGLVLAGLLLFAPLKAWGIGPWPVLIPALGLAVWSFVRPSWGFLGLSGNWLGATFGAMAALLVIASIRVPPPDASSKRKAPEATASASASDVAAPVKGPAAIEPQSPGAQFAEHARKDWMVELDALPDTISDDPQEAVLTLDDLSKDAATGEGVTLTKAERASGEKFMRALSAKQSRLYPQIRKNIGGMLGQQFFREDTDVATTGSESRTLLLTSFHFVSNATIDDLEKAMYPAVMKARFSAHGVPVVPISAGRISHGFAVAR